MKIGYFDFFMLMLFALLLHAPVMYIILLFFWILFMLIENLDAVIDDWTGLKSVIENVNLEDLLSIFRE